MIATPKPAKIGAIVLAAGNSSRLGQPKQLLEYNGVPLLRRTVAAAQAGDCGEILVVTGHAHEQMKSALRDTSVSLIHNTEWSSGIGTSIRAGVKHLLERSPDIDAALLLVCDQPFVTAEFLTTLISAYLRSSASTTACASSYSGTVGVPAIFSRSVFPDLLQLPETQGAKTILQSLRPRLELVPFTHGEIDIDTPADWAGF